MKLLLSVLAALVLIMPAAAQGPDVDAIIQKMVDKRVAEGTDLESIKSFKLTMTMMQPMQNMEMQMIMYHKKPESYRVENIVEVTGQKSIQTYNGETGWIVSNMGKKPVEEELGEDEIESLKERVNILKSDLENYKEKGIEVVYLTEDVVDDKEVHKLKIKEEDDERIIYVDKKEHVVVKSEATREIQGREVPFEYYPKNYSRENGILIPHAIEIKLQGQVVIINIFESFEFNIDLEDSLFDKPELE